MENGLEGSHGGMEKNRKAAVTDVRQQMAWTTEAAIEMQAEGKDI